MQKKKQWFKPVVCLALVRAMAVCAYAQESLPAAAAQSARPAIMRKAPNRIDNGTKNANSFVTKLEKAVGLTPEQRESVRGVMAEQRQQYEAVQEQSDAKLRALLNPEQQTKFDAFLARQKHERAARKRKPSK